MSTPTNERPDTGDVAARIARVAAQLFAEQGYDATSVRNIVEAAAVAKPALYYYFQSKEGLAHFLLTEPMTRLVAALQAILDGPADPVDKLEQVIDVHFGFCRENPDRARFVYALFFGPLGRSLAGELAQYGESMRQAVDNAVKLLVADGLVDPLRTEACATCIRGLIVAYTMDFLYRDLPLDPTLPQRCVRVALEGFAATTSIAPPH